MLAGALNACASQPFGLLLLQALFAVQAVGTWRRRHVLLLLLLFLFAFAAAALLWLHWCLLFLLLVLLLQQLFLLLFLQLLLWSLVLLLLHGDSFEVMADVPCNHACSFGRRGVGGVVVDLGQVVFQPEHGVDGTCRASSVPRFLCLQPVHKPRLILPVVRQIAVKDAPHLVFRVPRGVLSHQGLEHVLGVQDLA